MSTPRKYKISDLRVAAVLKADGYKVAALERQANTCFFVFEDKPGARPIPDRIVGFYNGQAQVNAQRLFWALSWCRDAIRGKHDEQVVTLREGQVP